MRSNPYVTKQIVYKSQTKAKQTAPSLRCLLLQINIRIRKMYLFIVGIKRFAKKHCLVVLFVIV